MWKLWLYMNECTIKWGCSRPWSNCFWGKRSWCIHVRIILHAVFNFVYHACVWRLKAYRYLCTSWRGTKNTCRKLRRTSRLYIKHCTLGTEWIQYKTASKYRSSIPGTVLTMEHQSSERGRRAMLSERGGGWHAPIAQIKNATFVRHTMWSSLHVVAPSCTYIKYRYEGLGAMYVTCTYIQQCIGLRCGTCTYLALPVLIYHKGTANTGIRMLFSRFVKTIRNHGLFPPRWPLLPPVPTYCVATYNDAWCHPSHHRDVVRCFITLDRGSLILLYYNYSVPWYQVLELPDTVIPTVGCSTNL